MQLKLKSSFTLLLLVSLVGFGFPCVAQAQTVAEASCGTLALQEVARVLKGDSFDTKQFLVTPTSSLGFSMAQLAEIANGAGLKLKAVQWPRGEPLVTPCVAHYREGHFVAVLGQRSGKYEVRDPLLIGPAWMSEEEVRTRTSGSFLVPEEGFTVTWPVLAGPKARELWGTIPGTTNIFADTNDGCALGGGGAGDFDWNVALSGGDMNNDNAHGDGEGCEHCGMVRWAVSEPYINLWLYDEPLGYQPNVGKRISFHLAYKQRPDGTPQDNIFNFGPNWNCSWLSFILYNPDLTNGPYVRAVPGGGRSSYGAGVGLYGSNSGVGGPGGGASHSPPEYHTQSTMSAATNSGGQPTNFAVAHLNGTVDYYGYLSANAYFGMSAAFLSAQVDAAGHSNLFNYVVTNGIVRLVTVVDADGRTNTLSYTNANYPAQVTDVTDPYGRHARMEYDEFGHLTGITDVVNITSTITYDFQGLATQLVTPYGTNRFFYTSSEATNNGINRSVTVVEPGDVTNLYLFRFKSQYTDSSETVPLLPSSYPSQLVPSNLPTSTLHNGTSNSPMYMYNSFHWGPRQLAALSGTNMQYFTPDDYAKATLKNWLIDSFNRIGHTISMRRDPSPGGTNMGEMTWFDYPGKSTNTVYQGTNFDLSLAARVLADGTTQYVWFNRDTNGHSTNIVTTYSAGPGATVATRTNSFGYHSNAIDVLTATNALGEHVTIAYNTNHQVTNLVDALNQTNIFSYNASNRNLTNIVFSSGATVTLTYYDSNNPPTATSGRLQQVEMQPQGRFIHFDDYSNGLPRVVRMTGTNLVSLSVTNSWDDLNRLTGVAFPDNTTISNVYTKLDLTAQKDRLGRWTYFVYDQLQHLRIITDPLTNATELEWCGCGALSSIKDASNRVTTLLYDNQGKLTNVAFPDSSSLSYQYDLSGRMTNVFDGSGRTVGLTFNNQGLVTAAKDATGASLLSMVYDILDRPQVMTGADGISVTNVFDVLGRLSTRSWASNIFEGFAYDVKGLKEYTNADLKVTRFVRDNAGRVTSVTNANQETVKFGYDAADRITKLTNGLNKVTTWGYNEYGLLTNKVDGLNHEVLRLYYDANGQVTNRWTPAATNTSYAYDVLGNLTNIVYAGNPATLSVSFTYDKLNQLKTMADAAGTHSFSYTKTGQLESEDGPWSSDTVGFGYTQGQRTSMAVGSLTNTYAYDALWRLTNLTSLAGGFNYSYLSSISSLVQGIALPNGASISNHFDSLKRMDGTALVNHWGHVLDGYTYGQDALGLRTNITRDLGLTTNTVLAGYDDIGQLTSWSGKESGGALRLNEQLGYGYDAANNLHLRTNGALVQTFSLDNANELTNITRSGNLTLSGATPAPAVNVTVNGNAADRYGDLTFARTNLSITNNGNNTFTIIASNSYNDKSTNTLTVNLPSSLSLTYDGNGNLTGDGTRIFIYDAEDQLTNVYVTNSWKSEFVYDGFGRRRMQRDYTWTGGWTRTAETRFVYDGMVPIQERDSNNVIQVTYTRGLDLSGSLQGAGGIGGLLARTDSSNVYYHADGAGNVTALMDGNQNIVARYLYDPFGRLVGKWGTLADANRYRFSSKEIHANSGTYYYGFRFYDTGLQRWLTRDPIGEMGGINLYGFVGNGPLRYADPFGTDGWSFLTDVATGTIIQNDITGILGQASSSLAMIQKYGTSGYVEEFGVGSAVVMILGESAGTTTFAEGWEGVDIGWGQALSPLESAERLTSGSISMAGNLLGARCLGKGFAAKPKPPIIKGKPFSNGQLGQASHDRFLDALRNKGAPRTLVKDWEMRTARGKKGVDATYVGPPSRYPGFGFAELKANSPRSVPTLAGQLERWKLPEGETQLWFYDAEGNLYYTGFTF